MPVSQSIPINQGFELHAPDEWHPATILDIEDSESGYGPSLKWIFNLEADPDDQETWAFCSQKTGKGSNLRRWGEPSWFDESNSRPAARLGDPFHCVEAAGSTAF